MPTLNVSRASPVLLTAALTFALAACARSEASGPPAAPPAPEVTVATVIAKPLRDFEEFTGRLQAVDSVEIRPRVSGFIDSVQFTEGARVRKGQLLFRIDPRPFQAEVNRLTAELRRTRSQAKLAEYRGYVSTEGALALYGGWSGLDLADYPIDEPLKYIDTDAARSALAIFTTADPTRTWTARDIAEYVGIGGIGPVIVGSPATVADELERWVEVGGVDGFNLAYVVTPGSFEEFVELVVPELRARGRLDEQPGSTLRGRLNGTGDATVPSWHPAHAYRGAFTDAPSAADARERETEGAA